MPWWACRVTRREREREINHDYSTNMYRCIIIIVYSKPGSLPRKRWVSRKDVFEQYGPSGRSSSQGVKNLGCRVRSASCCSRRLWLSSYDPQIHVEQSWTATNSMDCHEINHKTTDHDSELWKTPRRFYYTRILPPLILNSTPTSSKFQPSQVTSTKGSTWLTLPLPLPEQRSNEGQQRHSGSCEQPVSYVYNCWWHIHSHLITHMLAKDVRIPHGRFTVRPNQSQSLR